MNRIKHLDGMRGVAILMVVLFHTFVRWPDLLPFVEQTKDIYLLKYGHIGVRLFFIISGFVIFMSLDKTNNITSFIKKRWLRFFPAMFIASIFIFLTAHFFYERPAGIPHLANLIPGLTFISPEMINAIFGRQIEGLEGAFWSLYVEALFYIFAGAIYFLLGRKHLLKAIFIAGLISFVLFHFFHQTLNDYMLRTSVLLGFDAYIWFFMGCFMYKKIHNRNNKVDNLMMLLAVIGCLYVPHKDFKLVLMTGLVISLFCFSFYSGIIQKILSNKALIFFGFISYPLYLIHENMIVSSTVKIMSLLDFGRMGYLSPIIPILIVSIIGYAITKAEPELRSFLRMIADKNPINFTILLPPCSRNDYGGII